MEMCGGVTPSTVQGFQTTGPLMFAAIQSIFSAQSLIAPDLFPNLDINEIQRISGTPYDFIIVGAGTAGPLVANRLVSEGWTVLLLEAGGAPTMGTEIPGLFINNYESKEDWNFRTESQEKACLNYKERQCYWPRGKVLGGTSSINGMYYIIGNKEDYDEWESDNWKYDKIKKYFLKHETIQNITEIHNSSDEPDNINLEFNNEKHAMEELILKANQENAVDIIQDLNGPRQIGVGVAATTTKNGQRYCSYSAFLKPKSNDSKLTILKEAQVQEILFQDKVAVGVKFHMNSNPQKIYEITSKKEIILSAGTINSAHILLNSGIGPKTMLKSNTKVNLPVGYNLQDHVFAPIFFKMKSNDDSNTFTRIFQSFNEYFKNRKGPLSDLRPQRVVSFINTDDPSSDIPNIQNHFIVVYPNQSNTVDIFIHHKFSEQFYNSFNDLNKGHLILIIYVTLLQPKSKGQIGKEESKLKIKANYLHDDNDLDTLVKGMRHALNLKDTDAFKNAGLELHWVEIDSCKDIDITTDAFLKCIATHLTGTLYHAVGTNKMGKTDDNSTVVNENLLVKGVKKLRVIDASVMPKIIRGNTMAATLVIAEKGAEIIKDFWKYKS